MAASLYQLPKVWPPLRTVLEPEDPSLSYGRCGKVLLSPAFPLEVGGGGGGRREGILGSSCL